MVIDGDSRELLNNVPLLTPLDLATAIRVVELVCQVLKIYFQVVKRENADYTVSKKFRDLTTCIFFF